jgi:hypothetical protein
MALFHTYVAGRVHPHGHEPAGQDPHPGDPQDVPEAGDHVGEGAGLRDHLGDLDDREAGGASTEGLLAVEDQQAGQERDGHREGHDADPGRQVERARGQERLHQVDADGDQPAVDQIVLP